MATPVKEEDLLVPTSTHWSVDDVAHWVEELGFPEYRACFTDNLINGRKLILVDEKSLWSYTYTKLPLKEQDVPMFTLISSTDSHEIGNPRPSIKCVTCTCNLPRLGVTDFDHIKFISSSVRQLLALEDPYWNRSISIPSRSPMGTFLERKSRTGEYVDGLLYSQHLKGK